LERQNLLFHFVEQFDILFLESIRFLSCKTHGKSHEAITSKEITGKFSASFINVLTDSKIAFSEFFGISQLDRVS
jgi:hypothetical protein